MSIQTVWIIRYDSYLIINIATHGCILVCSSFQNFFWNTKMTSIYDFHFRNLFIGQLGRYLFIFIWNICFDWGFEWRLLTWFTLWFWIARMSLMNKLGVDVEIHICWFWNWCHFNLFFLKKNENNFWNVERVLLDSRWRQKLQFD